MLQMECPAVRVDYSNRELAVFHIPITIVIIEGEGGKTGGRLAYLKDVPLEVENRIAARRI
jgi:hypothetical protein